MLTKVRLYEFGRKQIPFPRRSKFGRVGNMVGNIVRSADGAQTNLLVIT